MATRSRPEELVEAALEGECVPLGDYKARSDKDGWVLTIPSVAADHVDVDSSTEFKTFLDQNTGAIVSIPLSDA